MPTFKYTVRDEVGKRLNGKQDAVNRSALIRDLRQQSLFPISVEEDIALPRAIVLPNLRVRERDISLFTRQLANLLDAGVVLPRALNFLVGQTNNSQLKETVERVRDEVVSGAHFWQALAKHPQTFSALYISMVKAGEVSGSLEHVMRNLANYSERKKALEEKIISMLIYPLILLVVGAGSIVFLMTAVIPKMRFIFDDLGATLPWASRLLMSLSVFLSHTWAFILLAIGVAGFAGYKLLRRRDMRSRWDRLMLKVPVWGDKVKKVAFARFTRILGLVLSNGVSLMEGLRIAQGVVQNEYMASRIEEVNKKVARGRPLSSSLREADIFPPLSVNMISVGEETGQLEHVLQKVSTMNEDEIQEETKRMISLLEPLLIVLLAIGIGSLVMAMLLPIFQMNFNIL